MIVYFTYVIRTQFTYEHSGEWEEMTEDFAHMIRTQVTWVCLVSKVMWKDLKHCWDLRVSVGAEVFLKAFLEAKGTFSEKAIKQKIQRREKWIFFLKSNLKLCSFQFLRLQLQFYQSPEKNDGPVYPIFID